jgi:hypothetical protein
MRRGPDAAWFYGSVLLLLLNALDAAFTLCAIDADIAGEANPMMQLLLHQGPLQFVLVKHLMVSLSVILLWRLRTYRLARVGFWSSLPIYTALFVYHVSMSSLMLA